MSRIAFTSPLTNAQLTQRKARVFISGEACSRRRESASSTRMLLSSSQSSSRVRATNLRERSVVTLRGLSDAAWCAILHEVSIHAVFYRDALSVSGLPSTQLMLGCLIGVWTAAAFAARIRSEQQCAVAASNALPRAWRTDRHVKAEDIEYVFAWLVALDEVESAVGAAALSEFAHSESTNIRVALARAIAANPVRANASLSALHVLSRDDSPRVRAAARKARAALREAGVLGRKVRLCDEGMKEEAEWQRLTRLLEEDEVLDVARERRTAWRWIARAVQWGGSKAVEGRAGKLKVPLFDGLEWSELHGVCAIAVMALAYEMCGLVDGVELPLRFVGLGWLFAVAGLAAYPQSGNLWTKIQAACALDAAQYRKS